VTITRTQDIFYLALRRGEITSENVVKELVDEVKNRREYRSLLAQASTLLRRLHRRGMLERKWVREHRGQYVYFPSDKVVISLLPALDVLEERKRIKEVEETLMGFAKEIILNLRLEDEVKGILWNPLEIESSKEGVRLKVWVLISDMKKKDVVERKAKENQGTVKIDPTFVTPNHLSSLQNIDFLKILYGWNFIASMKQNKRN